MSVEIPNGRTPPLCVYFCNGEGGKGGRGGRGLQESGKTGFWGRDGSWSIDAHLLNATDIASDVFDRHRILNSQTMALTLHTSLVDEYSCVGGETCFPSGARKARESRLFRTQRATTKPYPQRSCR